MKQLFDFMADVGYYLQEFISWCWENIAICLLVIGTICIAVILAVGSRFS